MSTDKADPQSSTSFAKKSCYNKSKSKHLSASHQPDSGGQTRMDETKRPAKSINRRFPKPTKKLENTDSCNATLISYKRDNMRKNSMVPPSCKDHKDVIIKTNNDNDKTEMSKNERIDTDESILDSRSEQRSPLNLVKQSSYSQSSNPRPTSIEILTAVPLNLSKHKDIDLCSEMPHQTISTCHSEEDTVANVKLENALDLSVLPQVTDVRSCAPDSLPVIDMSQQNARSVTLSSPTPSGPVTLRLNEENAQKIVNTGEHPSFRVFFINSGNNKDITGVASFHPTGTPGSPVKADSLNKASFNMIVSPVQANVTDNAKSSASTDLDALTFKPLHESTNDGFEFCNDNSGSVEEKNNKEPSSPSTNANAFKELTDELTSLNEDSLLISTSLFKRQTPRKKYLKNESEETSKNESDGKSKSCKKTAYEEKRCSKKTTPKVMDCISSTAQKSADRKNVTPSKNRTKTSTPNTSPLATPKKTPKKQKDSNSTEARYKRKGSVTPKKTPAKKRKTSDSLNPSTLEKSPTSILKKSPDAKTSAKTKVSTLEMNKRVEKCVTFSTVKNKRRRRPSRMRGRGIRFSLEKAVADHHSKKKLNHSNISANLSMDMSMDRSGESSRLTFCDTEDSLLSDGEGKLKIMEDDGDEDWEDESTDEETKKQRNEAWDEEIQRKCVKHKISRKNVRSIIHRIVTNEHVSAMFRRCLVEEGMAGQVQEAIFEPKMTRSKVKDVLEKGDFPQDWAMSPLKVLHNAPKQSNGWSEFLGGNLTDPDESATREENDSDYDPTQDPDTVESDDDESVMSSHVSDFGSPFSQNTSQPATPTISSAAKKQLSFKAIQSPAPSETANDEDGAGGYRTRSRHPLHDKDLDELETELYFHAPDIEPDIYNFDYMEEDYAEFLKSVYKGKDSLNETNDDENNDAEFDFIGEEEQVKKAEADDSSDDEEYRYDLETKIGKRELNQLLDELFEEYGGGGVVRDDDEEEDMVAAKTIKCNKESFKMISPKNNEGQFSQLNESGSISNNTFTNESEKYPGHMAPLSYDISHAALLMTDIIKISHDADVEKGRAPVSLVMTMLDKLRLQQQMCEYVQILATSFVQSYNNDALKQMSDMSCCYLTELDRLGKKSFENGIQEPVFNTPNLPAALELCKSVITENRAKLVPAFGKEMIAKKIYHNKEEFETYGLSFGQMHQFMSSKAFVYPDKIPTKAFARGLAVRKPKRISFTKSEDLLLACALRNMDGFSHVKKYEFVHETLMPTKTRLQLVQRVKHLKQGHINDRHDVQMILKSNGVAPTMRPNVKDLEEPVQILEPYYRKNAQQPAWLEVFKTLAKRHYPSDLLALEVADPNRKVPGKVAQPLIITPSTDTVVGQSGLKQIDFIRHAVGYERTPSPPIKYTPLARKANKKAQNPNFIVLPPKTPGMSNPTGITYQPILIEPTSVKENTPPVSKSRKKRKNEQANVGNKLNPGLLGALINLYSGGFSPSPGGIQIIAAPAFIQNTKATPSRAITPSVTSPPAVSNLPPPVTVQRSADGSRFDLVPLTSTPLTSSQRTVSSERRSHNKKSSQHSKKGAENSTNIVASTSKVIKSEETPTHEPINIAAELISGGEGRETPTKELEKLCNTPQTPSRSGDGQLSPRSLHKIVFGTPQSEQKGKLSSNLIGSAMAEVVGLSPSKLGTPDGLSAMGISPAKIPALSAQMRKDKVLKSEPDAKRSLATVLETMEESNVSQDMTSYSDGEESSSEQCKDGPQNMIDPKHSPTPFANASLLENPNDLPSFTKLSPVPVMNENSGMFSDKDEKSRGFDTVSDTLVTPKKLTFTDEITGLRTPQRVLENKLKKYGESPDAKRFMNLLDTPIKRTAFMIEELANLTAAQQQTSPGMTSHNSPEPSSKNNVRSLTSQAAGAITSSRSESNQRTPAKTRKVVELLEQMAYEAGSSPETSIMSPPQSRTPARTQGVQAISAKPHGRASPDEVLTIEEASGLASISSQCSNKSLRTPPKCRPILPKGKVSPPKTSFLDDLKHKKESRSKTSKITSRKPRTIAPKGVLYVSPTKQVAAAITAKAKQYLSPAKAATSRGRFRAILPKSPLSPMDASETCTPPTESVGVLTPPTATRGSKRRIFSPPPPQSEEKEIDMGDNEESEDDEETRMMVTRLRKKRRLLAEASSAQEDDVAMKNIDEKVEVSLKMEVEQVEEKNGDNGDSQDEIDYDRLLAASSTVRYDPKDSVQDSTQPKTKFQMKKDAMIEMLAPDLIENDPLNDERDTAYAQQYMTKVKETFKHDESKFQRFLHLLHEFGLNKNSPVQLYNDISVLFEGYPELIDDFAPFLLPSQAKECGCFMLLQEYLKARTFLRKLELHFKKLPGMLQRVLNAFGKWDSLKTKSVVDLQAEIKPLLKGQQYLMDEFSTFFGDAPVPESHMTDFEEVTFPGSSDEEDKSDSCEEVTLPEDQETTFGTRSCTCECHNDASKADFHKRSKHCLSCGLKVVRGRMYLMSEDKLRPVNIKPHTPIKSGEEEQTEGGAPGEPGEDVELSLSDIEEEEETEEAKEEATEEEPEDTQTDADEQGDILDDDEDEDEAEGEADEGGNAAAEEDGDEAEDDGGDEEEQEVEEAEEEEGSEAEADEQNETDDADDMLDEDTDDGKSQQDVSDAVSDADTLASREISEVDSPMPLDDTSQRSNSPSAVSIESSQNPPSIHSTSPSQAMMSEVNTESKEYSANKETLDATKAEVQPRTTSPLSTKVKQVISKVKLEKEKEAKTSSPRRESPKRTTRPRRVAFTTLQRKLPTSELQSSFGEFNIGEFIKTQKKIIRSRSQQDLETKETETSKPVSLSGVHHSKSEGIIIHGVNSPNKGGHSDKSIVSNVSKAGTSGTLKKTVKFSCGDVSNNDSDVKVNKRPIAGKQLCDESSSTSQFSSTNKRNTLSPSRKTRFQSSDIRSPVPRGGSRETPVLSPGPLSELSLFGTISSSTSAWDESMPKQSTHGSNQTSKETAVRLDFSSATSAFKSVQKQDSYEILRSDHNKDSSSRNTERPHKDEGKNSLSTSTVALSSSKSSKGIKSKSNSSKQRIGTETREVSRKGKQRAPSAEATTQNTNNSNNKAKCDKDLSRSKTIQSLINSSGGQKMSNNASPSFKNAPHKCTDRVGTMQDRIDEALHTMREKNVIGTIRRTRTKSSSKYDKQPKETTPKR